MPNNITPLTKLAGGFPESSSEGTTAFMSVPTAASTGAINLPTDVYTGKIEATSENDVMGIDLPSTTGVKLKKVAVSGQTKKGQAP